MYVYVYVYVYYVRMCECTCSRLDVDVHCTCRHAQEHVCLCTRAGKEAYPGHVQAVSHVCNMRLYVYDMCSMCVCMCVYMCVCMCVKYSFF